MNEGLDALLKRIDSDLQCEMIDAKGCRAMLVELRAHVGILLDARSKAWSVASAVNSNLEAEKQELERLRTALRFYGNGMHFVPVDRTQWDTVSGEPQNYLCDENDSATIEDGTIARMALLHEEIDWEGEPPKPIVGEKAEILGVQCIDGGKCHHHCTAVCFRRVCCGPLDGYTGPWELGEKQ